jgi:hypothetical protein
VPARDAARESNGLVLGTIIPTGDSVIDRFNDDTIVTKAVLEAAKWFTAGRISTSRLTDTVRRVGQE